MKKAILIFLIVTFSGVVAVFGFDINQLYGFKKYSDEPILLPGGTGIMAKAVFNPTAIVKNGKVYMLFREQDWTGVGRWNGTSRIGLAESGNGLDFKIVGNPVVAPSLSYEIPGGCEDPRVIAYNGTYYLTYTAYNGSVARLCEAESTDLIHWKKLGPIFPNASWSKSGAILNRKVNGKYVMYYGDTSIYIAYSNDLVHWKSSPYPVISPRPGMFDSTLVEPGPAPVMTDKGILLIYNGADYSHKYSVGAVVFSKDDPTQILYRLDKPFLEPTESWEKNGQTPEVVFAEGLAMLKNEWILYYGAADTYVGAAVLKVK